MFFWGHWNQEPMSCGLCRIRAGPLRAPVCASNRSGPGLWPRCPRLSRSGACAYSLRARRYSSHKGQDEFAFSRDGWSALRSSFPPARRRRTLSLSLFNALNCGLWMGAAQRTTGNGTCKKCKRSFCSTSSTVPEETCWGTPLRCRFGPEKWLRSLLAVLKIRREPAGYREDNASEMC